MFRIIFWDKERETYYRIDHVTQLNSGFDKRTPIFYIFTTDKRDPIILQQSKFKIERIEQELKL